MDEQPSGKKRGPSVRQWTTGLALLNAMILGGIAYSLLEVWRSERALAWPTASAAVVQSTVGGGCGRSGNGHRPFVRYKYRVGGVEHEGGRILFGAANCYSLQQAKAIADRFPFGSTATVRYDPEAPAESVLIAGRVDESTSSAIYLLSFWFLITAAATGMVVTVQRSKRNPSRGLPPQRELGGG